MVDRLITLSRPSAPQKRAWANGRSAEMHSTTVLFSWLASALNLRTEVAQVGVSTLGKMFSTLRLPARLARVTSLRSPATRLKAGACWPACGSWPSTCTGLPLRVTCAIGSFLIVQGVEGQMCDMGIAAANRPSNGRSRPDHASSLAQKRRRYTRGQVGI